MRPAPARPTGGRAARQKDGPPPAGMRAAPEAHPPRGGAGGKAERVRGVNKTPGPAIATRRRGRAAGPGRVSPPSPSTHHHGGGREERGPRERKREERPHSPRMSVPRPARLGPGPGEREVTTSIKLETEPTERPRPGKARHRGAGGYSKGQGGGPARSAPHSRRRRRRDREPQHNTAPLACHRNRAGDREEARRRNHGQARAGPGGPRFSPPSRATGARARLQVAAQEAPQD